jgi:hypothetical protein
VLCPARIQRNIPDVYRATDMTVSLSKAKPKIPAKQGLEHAEGKQAVSASIGGCPTLTKDKGDALNSRMIRRMLKARHEIEFATRAPRGLRQSLVGSLSLTQRTL